MRKKCEKKNWFEYGQSVALKGLRLGSDQFYNQCKKAEAEFDEMSADQGFKKGMNTYCSKEAPYDYGKRGKPYNFEFCDHTYIAKMKSEHKKGLRVYCRPSNGFPEGIKGDPYNKLCPMDMEAKFLKGFNKGRIKYLRSEIVKYRHEVRDLERDIKKKEYDLREYKTDLRDLNYHYSDRAGRSSISIENGRIYIGRRNRNRFRTKEEVDSERGRLESEVRSLESRVSSMERKRSVAREKIREFEKEIAILTE